MKCDSYSGFTLFDSNIMWHLNKYLKYYPQKIKVDRVKLHLSGNVGVNDVQLIKECIKLQLNDKIKYSHFSPEEEHRSVSLIEGDQKYILKRARIVRWKKALYNRLGIRYGWGYRDVMNEFVSLHCAKSLVKTIPTVYGFGYSTRKGLFIDEEVLLMSFKENTITLDSYLKENYSEDKSTIKVLAMVFSSFSKLIEQGVVHLDPHPKNILLSKDLKDCWFIDLEWSCFTVVERDALLGYFCGFLLVYWVKDYIDEQEYDNYVQSEKLNMNLFDVDIFDRMYVFFKQGGFSRKKRSYALSDKNRFSEFLENVVGV